jgi:hypothetical protein
MLAVQCVLTAATAGGDAVHSLLRSTKQLTSLIRFKQQQSVQA